MQRSHTSRGANGSEQTLPRTASTSQSSGIFSNLKKLATGGNHGSNPQANQSRKELISSPKRVFTTASLEAATPISSNKPLNKNNTLNTHNISHYTMEPETHSRSHSASLLTSPTKYSYSRRSSQLTRSSTNRSMLSSSAASVSSNSTTVLNRFLTNDGTLKLERPENVEEIDGLFMDLLIKRNVFDTVSPQDQKDMLNYPIEKKWLMVKQDLQSEFKRLKNTKPRYSNNENSHTVKRNGSATKLNTQYEHMLQTNNSETSLNSPSHSPPEYYVRQIISKKIKNKELNDLWVSLRTEPLDWVISFLDAQGQIAIANLIITSMHQDTTDNMNAVHDLQFLERETSLFKCLRVLLNIRECLEEAVKSTLITNALVEGLLSTRISTRRLATETLIYLVAKDEDLKTRTMGLDTFPLVMESLNHEMPITQNIHIKAKIASEQSAGFKPQLYQVSKILQQWFYVLEHTLDGRGKMGSLVGASEEYKNTNGENSIFEYLVESIVLINQLCLRSEDVKKRHMMRTQLKTLGLNRILQKMQLLDYPPLTTVLLQFEDAAIDDYNILLESQKSTENVNMDDPVSILQRLSSSLKGTEAESYLLSVLQNLFLSSNKLTREGDDPSKCVQQLKLIDSLISNVAITSIDSESNFNVAIQRLYDAMQTDEIARRAILESRELTKKLEEVKAERDYLNEKISKAENGLVGQLQEELAERDLILSKTQRVTEQLQSELEELKKKHLLEKHEHELELRKMLTMVNSKNADYSDSNNKPKSDPKPLNPERKTAIQNVLQKSLQKTEQDLLNESRRLGTAVGSKSRLKLLRSKMEDIENEARELEMTNFAEFKPKQTAKDKQKIKAEQKSKLAELRKKLALIQNESNDITKFNIEQRVNELFKDKKLAALDRLKDLEQKYNGFHIDFSEDPELKELLNDNSETASLDPKIAQQKLEEMNTIISELNALKKEMENKVKSNSTELSEASSNSSTSSSSSSSSAEDLLQSGDSQNSDVVSNGSSFLESLTQKYGTGHQPANSISTNNIGRETRYPGSGYHRKSFFDRLKHTSVNPGSSTDNPPLFLSELKSKIKVAEEIPNSTANSADRSSEKSPGNDTELNPKPSSEPVDNEDIPNGLQTPVSQTIIEPSSLSKDAPSPPPLPAFLRGKTSSTPSIAPTAGVPPPPPPPPMPPSLSSPLSVSAGSGGAPPPPPPPPPPFPSATTPKSTTIESPLLPQSPSLFERYPRPKKKLKQLHWEKIDNTGDSIWKNAQAEKVADDLYERGVLSQLEKAFAAREVKSLKGKSKDSDEKITFLSRDVSQQFGINLHMYSNISVKDVVAKVLKCDREFLSTPSVIEFLSKPTIIEVTNNLARNFTPYSTDWEGITSVEEARPPEKDPTELQRADQIYLELMFNLQSYWGSRMRALTMITTYEKDYSDLVTKLRSIDKAVQAIQASNSLRHVFDVILAVGNYMNDSSKQAQGFKLSTLQRLSFIKDEKNSMTFLNYVEKIIRDNYPEYSHFVEELEPIFNVTKISIEQLVADCREFSQSIKNIERSIEIGNLSDPSKFHPWDRVLNKVVPVLPEARKKADLLNDEVKLSLLEFENLMKKFGEDANDKFSKNSFFQKFADFITDFKKAKTFNQKIEEEERAYERRKKLIEDQQRKQQESAQGDSLDGANSFNAANNDDRDVMDKLLNKLKNAGPAKGDPSSARKRALARKRLMEGKGGSSVLDNITADPTVESVIEENAPFTTSPVARKFSQSPNVEPASNSKQDPADRARNLLLELRGTDDKIDSSTNIPKAKDRLRDWKNRDKEKDKNKDVTSDSDSAPTRLQFHESADTLSDPEQAQSTTGPAATQTSSSSEEEFTDAQTDDAL